MKKLTLLFCFAIISVMASAQIITPPKPTTQAQKDSLIFQYLDIYRNQLRDPAFELYPTQNMWNFLKLNTATGAITMVQFSLESRNRFECVLDITPKIYSQDDAICGRFKLVPTQNMYNFLMLDQIDGRVWQVQWSFEEQNRSVVRIY